jgi:hypothetical protein
LRGPWQRDRTIKTPPPGRRFLSLIDLGTSSVKALVVELQSNQTHLWGHGQAPIEGGYTTDGMIVDREAVATACDLALSAAEEMTLNIFGHKLVADQSVWSVPGWLCQGQNAIFQQRRSRPAKPISRKERQSLQMRLDRTVACLAGVPVDVVSTVQVDGNSVTEVLGLRGETLTLQAFIVTVKPGPLATLRAIADDLELDPPTFVSQARAAAAGLGQDGVLLDMGRWGSGIAVARQGQLAGAAWVSMGGQSLYRTLSNNFGLTPSQLLGFCQAYTEGWMPPENRVAVDAALESPVTRWLDRVAEQLSALAAETTLPHQVFLAGGACRFRAVLEGARHYDWLRWFPWPRHPEIRTWQATTMSGLTDHTDQAWGASDLVRLGLARLAGHME